MRLTVEDAEKQGLLGKVKVKVDGQYVKGATIADEEQGYIERFKYKDGKVVINYDLEEAEREIIKGHVQIEIDGDTNEASETQTALTSAEET